MQKIHVTKVACNELSQPVRPESIAGSISETHSRFVGEPALPAKEAQQPPQINDSLSHGN